ncbi:MAG: dihydromonapterin reductase/dihydrofolate reductase [Gammaproteobacteria bacterium]|jgi:dihydromonapterin reductase/dihydrofolate reductase
MQRMMQIHAVASYLQDLAPLLRASENVQADIIHVGDFVSGCGSSKHIADAVSKAAQDNLTLLLVAKLAPKIKVNSIFPALMLFNPTDTVQFRKKALDKSLMRCGAGFDEFQHSVDYLLASGDVSGWILSLDDGRHLV